MEKINSVQKSISTFHLGIVLTTTFAALAVQAQAGAVITIQAGQPGAIISSNLFGIFFEEINFAGEGGLYAEMVRNRSFYTATNANYWTLVTQGTATGTMSVDPSQPLNTNIPNSLKLTMQSGTGSVGAGNSGFWGMSLQAGATYYLNFYAMGSSGYAGPVVAQLQNASGSTVYAQASFSGLTTSWQHFAASLVSSGTDTNAHIVLSITNAGTIWLDVVSLFPSATFYNRTNGLRLDLANMLAALHPSFLRYPGGNYIEGANITNAVRWKKTIGDIAQRPGHMDDAWGYWSTDGFGYHEFLQFCEDMGMEPLYAINCGLALGYNGSTNNTVPLSQMGPWVQDALDAIQYANGDTNTTWGALRAANGHPAPFNLQYMEIGNESGGTYYNDRYTLFYDAIKSNYPSIHLIAPGNWSGGPPWSRPVEIQDQHYYSVPTTFYSSYATMYDNYSRNGAKVFVGEYAVTSGYGTYGDLASALPEAVFMTGLERNSDLVQMASYAPLFANVNGMQWQPDLIYYDSSRGVFGTPSYYVQELFSQNRGDVVLPTVVSGTNLLYASSSLLQSSSQIIVKVVNLNYTLTATFNVTGVNSVASSATVIQLTSSSATNGNSLASPTYVFPVTNSIANAGTSFSLTLPASSLSIIRLTASGINSYTNLLLQFASPINRGQMVASTVWGQESGNWINLTTNANHAITYASADPSIAVVDSQGNITGEGSGTTSIIATYASLGLSATQSVQVVNVPTALVHRYSFNDGTANDSVGSANGTLHGNATISGGQLVLPNTTSVAPATDYLQLSAGILTNNPAYGIGTNNNDPAVTVEAWATIQAGQYTWANLFDFGNQDASGQSEYDIHVCVHASDNSTIAGISDSDNANVDYQFIDLDPGSSLDGSTNVHITAVFSPPTGYMAIYLNGVLAGADYNVTIPMSGVQAVRNIIGADNWPDPGMQGTIDEFRIYNGALTANEIAATQVLGPSQLLSTASPAITASASGGSLTLSWPVASAGYTLLTTTNLAAGDWTAAMVTPQIVGSQWQVVLTITGNVRFYRLQE
ncbi:MAG: alpha-L-arabinofuranosidase C-terminal domain-containing protein [Verrucomicrobiia bacterium]